MGNRSGMALVLALMAISFLVAITVQLFATVNWQVQASAHFQESISFDAMNRSALSLARAVLLADQNANEFDSPFDDWSILDKNNLEALFGNSDITVNVTDLSGKLQVNALVSNEKDGKKRQAQEKLQYDLWWRFLTSGKFAIEDEEEAAALIDSIKDWIDEDDNERDKGAEDGFYLSQENPYVPRNAPVLYLEELLFIRGMTKDIFYGNEEYLGLAEYVTVTGRDGMININSAPAEVLKALADGVDDEMAQSLITFRQDEENKDSLANPEWYRQVSGFPGDIALNKEVITVISYYFRVTSIVRMNDMSRKGSGVIYRDESGAQRLLRWDIE
jgi:general secretion pathway protein K